MGYVVLNENLNFKYPPTFLQLLIFNGEYMVGLVIAGIAALVLLVFLKSNFTITDDEKNAIAADDAAKQKALEEEKAAAEKERLEKRRRLKMDKSTDILVQVMEDGSVSEIRRAMSNGINVLQKLENNQNLLMIAVKNNQSTEVVHFLLEQGIEINDADDNGQTALILATAFNPNPEVIKTLLDCGADKTVKDKMNKTAADYVLLNTALFGTDIGELLKV